VYRLSSIDRSHILVKGIADMGNSSGSDRPEEEIDNLQQVVVSRVAGFDN
jgi:hypothetical protein